MTTLEEMGLILPEERFGNDKDFQEELKELKKILRNNERIECGMSVTHNGVEGIFVATDLRMIFISADKGTSEKPLATEIYLYEHSRKLTQVEEKRIYRMALVTKDYQFIFESRTEVPFKKTFKYLQERILKVEKSNSLIKQETPAILGISQSSANTKNKAERKEEWRNRYKKELLVIFVPYLGFLAYFIMAYRAKKKTYTVLGVFQLMLTTLAVLILSPKGAEWYVIGSVLWIIAAGPYFVGINAYLREVATYENSREGQREKRRLQKKLEGLEALSIFKQMPPKKVAEISATERVVPPAVNEQIGRMRQLNIAIEDSLVSCYLDQMEVVCSEIFEFVEKYPEEEDKIQSFVKYFLPETFALLDSYDELSRKEIKTDAMDQSMNQITESLAMILEAFQNLYNKLHQDKAFHISADIKVLKDMLEQHGLTKDSTQFELKE